jgi:hypothetical protein
MATRTQRNRIVAIWQELNRHSSLAGYREVRPMEIVKLTWAQMLANLQAGKTWEDDCSGTITAVCKWSGLKSPSGPTYPYSKGYGNSETMLAYLRNYFAARLARTGAIVHFQNPDHVAQVLKPSPLRGNPIIGQHGAPGISIVPLSVERPYHSGPVTFLSISKL